MNESESPLVLGEQSRLEPMLAKVLNYGIEHPDQFGGYGLHWHYADDASVFVSFTGDLASHREVLVQRVEFPDELIVCQAAASEADRNAIQTTLVSELAGRYSSIGSDAKSGRVTVALNPTEVQLAGELVERYGAAVDVNVGALDYPIDDAQAVCPRALDATLIDGLDVRIIFDAVSELRASSAGSVGLIARVTNTSDDPIRLESGQPTAAVTDALGVPRTLDVRGVADVGVEIALQPGAHQDFEIDVSLASCDPADGYLLPGGEHFVVLSFYNAHLQGAMSSKPLPITIADE